MAALSVHRGPMPAAARKRPGTARAAELHIVGRPWLVLVQRAAPHPVTRASLLMSHRKKNAFRDGVLEVESVRKSEHTHALNIPPWHVNAQPGKLTGVHPHVRCVNARAEATPQAFALLFVAPGCGA